MIEHSRKLAAALAGGDDAAFVRGAFLRVLARPPTAEEAAACVAHLAAAAGPRERARANLVLVLFNHNDFVTIR